MPTMDLAEFGSWCEQSAADLERDYQDSERRTIEEALIIAEDQSSGPYSTADLARMGHPYARRHRKPLEDPRRINAQSGMFRGMWDTEGPSADGESAIFNTDPKAPLLAGGTQTMFPRPVDEAIEERLEPGRESRIEHALNRLTS